MLKLEFKHWSQKYNNQPWAMYDAVFIKHRKSCIVI